MLGGANRWYLLPKVVIYYVNGQGLIFAFSVSLKQFWHSVLLLVKREVLLHHSVDKINNIDIYYK